MLDHSAGGGGAYLPRSHPAPYFTSCSPSPPLPRRCCQVGSIWPCQARPPRRMPLEKTVEVGCWCGPATRGRDGKRVLFGYWSKTWGPSEPRPGPEEPAPAPTPAQPAGGAACASGAGDSELATR